MEDKKLKAKSEVFIMSSMKKVKQEEALKQLIKESVKEWCENTTSHGFSNMVKTDSWVIRSVWIVLVVVSMTYCFYCKPLHKNRFLQILTNLTFYVKKKIFSFFGKIK